MTDALHIVGLWGHILGIALYVGPQFFMALAWVPASRQISDPATRIQAMRTVTTRFAWIAVAGLVIIVIAGTYLISSWRDYYHIPDDVSFTSYRYGVLFIIKMNLFVLLLVVTGIHMFLVGPQLIDRLEAQAQGGTVTDADIRKARMWSMTFSMIGLLLALGIMVFGVMMNTATFSVVEI